MENNVKNSINNTQPTNKKIVRRIVKIIDEKDLNNVDIKKEINAQKKKKQLEIKKIERTEKLIKREKEKIQQNRIKQAEKQRLLKEKEVKKEKLLEEKRKKKEIKKQNKIEIKRNKSSLNKQYQYTKGQKILRVVKIAFVSIIFTGIAGICSLSLILYSWCKDLPEIDISELNQSALTSYIYDTNGNLITTYSSAENREWVELDDMPQILIDAFISVEDKRFYSHGAIDFKRFLNAVLGQITGSGDSGGSTITQQLVKNVYLTNEVTYKRKMQEIVLSYELEKQMSKDEILEAYLNIIYFGSSNYGVAAAAKDYFGKDLDELTLREIAILAGIPKNPNGYNPRRNTYVKHDMSATDKRTDTVLWVMKENGVISEEQYNIALNDTVEIKEDSSFFEMYDYAHAVEYSMSEVIQDFLTQRGLDNTYENRIMMENEIRQGGYSIYTTIDPDIQTTLQNTVENWTDYPFVLNMYGDPIEIDGVYEKPQVAAVIIDHSNGHILAMIGSRDTITFMKTFNRAISNNMPVASTLKPLAVYGPTLEKGLSAGSIEYNYKTYINGYDNISAYPGGQSPEAPVTMREAIAHSYNIAAARFLVNNVGYELSENYLIQLGIDKTSIQKNGAGLALGTSGIDMLELTAAYQSFANGGWYYEPKSYTVVLNNKGEIVLNSEDFQTKRQVFSEETAWMMTDLLSNTVENGNAYNALLENVEVAGKTGTHETKCAVFAGYTPDYVSCIWVGSDSFSDLSDASGSKIAAPIWKKYMSDIYDIKGITREKIYDSVPNSINKVVLCGLSGKLAGAYCDETFEDYINTNFPIATCDLHVMVDLCNYSGMIAGNDCLEQSITTKPSLFIPINSNFASIPESIILEHYPNAIIESPDNICISHVNGIVIPSEVQIGYAKNLLLQINELRQNTLLSEDYINLLNIDYASVENYVARAENALYNSIQESNEFYSEYFAEYNRVKGDLDNIRVIIDTLSYSD